MVLCFDGDELFRIEHDGGGRATFTNLFGTPATPTWSATGVSRLPFIENSETVRIARRVFGDRWRVMLTDSALRNAQASALEGMVRDAVRRFGDANGDLAPLPTTAQPNDYSRVGAALGRVISQRRRKEFRDAVAQRCYAIDKLYEIAMHVRRLKPGDYWEQDEFAAVRLSLDALLDAQREHWRKVY